MVIDAWRIWPDLRHPALAWTTVTATGHGRGRPSRVTNSGASVLPIASQGPLATLAYRARANLVINLCSASHEFRPKFRNAPHAEERGGYLLLATPAFRTEAPRNVTPSAQWVS